MKYKRLGSSGLLVSRIGFGGFGFGDPDYKPWILAEAEARPFFRKALESGINFFDTADMYSLGVGEEVMGRILRNMARRDEIVLATKVFYPMSNRPNRGGLSRKHIIQACEASLRRLGVETIDLYQIHRFDPDTPLIETLAALDLLVRQGKVRYIGASSGYAWQMMKALSLSDRHGWARFISMQNHYNLVYREEEREMIPLCRAEGIGLIPWSPLARGLLARTDDAEPSRRARNDHVIAIRYDHPGDRAVAAAVRQVAASRGIQPAEVALAWLLSRPGVVAPIVGFSKLSHLDAALRAVDLELTEDECRLLEAPYRPHTVRGIQMRI